MKTRRRIAVGPLLTLATTAAFALAATDAKADPPVASGTASASASATTTTASASASTANGANGDWDSTDVNEDPAKRYYFIGLRYRGNVIPKFMLNAFVDEGATFYSNTIGIELDSRKDGFSVIPAISYTEYGTGGSVLFHEKNKPDTANNWSYVDSSLKALYVTFDFLWSHKLHKNVDFEYGLAAGIGFIFGDLVNNWVFDDSNGTLTAASGRRFSGCQSETQNGSCQRSQHSNSDTPKVGGFTEPTWFSGGSKPPFFLWLTPQIGLRFKPLKQLESRLSLGFSLTGFWFGLSADYGLEKKPDAKPSQQTGLFRFGGGGPGAR